MNSPEYQCDMKMCTEEGVVYGQCIEHAPDSWLSEVLEEEPPILDEEQREKAREELGDEAVSSDETPGSYETVDGIKRRAEHFDNPFISHAIDSAVDRIEERPDGSGYEIAPPPAESADDSLDMFFHFGVLVGAALEREYPASVEGGDESP